MKNFFIFCSLFFIFSISLNSGIRPNVFQESYNQWVSLVKLRMSDINGKSTFNYKEYQEWLTVKKNWNDFQKYVDNYYKEKP